MQTPGKGQFQAGIPIAQASGVNVAANNPVTGAVARAGNAIGNLGDLAEALQEEKQRQFLAEAELKMSKASADLQYDLIGNANPEDHVRMAQDKYDSVKAEILANSRYSPRFQRDMEQRLDLFANRSIEKVTLDARLAQVENGKRLQKARIDNYISQGDYGSARATAQEGTGTYWSKEDAEILGMGIDNTEADQQLELSTMQNPRETAEKLKSDPNFAKHLSPLARMNAIEHAKAEYNKVVAQSTDEFQDDLATGAVSTPEQIAQKYGEGGRNLRPAVLEEMNGILAKRLDFKNRAIYQTEGYQNETVGKISEMLGTYKPETEGYDAAYVKMDEMIRTLPTGSAARDELTKQIRAAAKGDAPDDSSPLGVNLKLAMSAFKGDFFGRMVTKQSIGQVMGAKFLEDTRDGQFMRSVGLTADEAKQVKGGATDTDRKKLFAQFWNEVKGKDASSYFKTVAKALRDGHGNSYEMSFRDPVKDAKALDLYGKTITETIKWSKLNPDKGVDDIRNHMLEFAAPGAADAFIDSALETDERAFSEAVRTAQDQGFTGALPDGSFLDPIPPEGGWDSDYPLLPPLNQ